MIDRKRTEHADWTDLQFLVELARHGSLSGAARALDVTHATVARRIGALDAAFGQPLFKRDGGRYVPTTTGAHIVALALEMEEPALRISRAMAGLPLAVAGTVRITATDLIAGELIAPMVAELGKSHPALEIELVASTQNLSLARREADVALRLGRPTEGDLFTRKLGDMSYLLYGSPRYLRGRAPQDFQYIGYCNISPEAPEVRALSEICRPDQIVFRTNQITTRRAAIETGVGIGLLPKLMADGKKGLVRVEHTPALVRELWLIVHRDLRDVPRIRTCIDFIGKAVERQRERMS